MVTNLTGGPVCRFLRPGVYLVILVLFITGLQAAGPLCNDPKKPWQCSTLKICYSDSQRCNGINDCSDLSDESNCTNIGVTKHLIIYNKRNRQGNLAWLVTPVILGVGLLYAIYKCFNEGLCHIRRMRLQRAQEAQGSYFALDQVSFFSMAPLQRTAIGSPGRQLMVVHNHHFSLSMPDPLPPPPLDDDDTPHTGLTPPPTYAEAMNPGISNAGFAAVLQADPDLPPYKELPTPPPPITPPPGLLPLTPPPISPPPSFIPRTRSRAASAPSRSALTSPSRCPSVIPLTTTFAVSTTTTIPRVQPAQLALRPMSTRSRHMSDSPALSRPSVMSPTGVSIMLPWMLPTSSHISSPFIAPSVSPLLTSQVSVPSLQELVNFSVNCPDTNGTEAPYISANRR